MSRVFSVFRSGLSRFLLAAFLAALVSPSWAEDDSAFSFRGFGTIGATRTNTRDANFVRDLSQRDGAVNRWDGRTDSLLGVQANYRFNSKLEGVLQGVSRYRYDKSYTPDITWAYLKFDPTPQVSLRAGRLGTEFFMLADSRLVGYSFLTVRPPGDFFWHLPFYSIDGADATYSQMLGDGIIRGKLFSGISDERIALATETWKLDGSRMSGGYIDYTTGPWMFRASYANIRFRNDLPVEKLLKLLPTAAMGKQAKDYLATENSRSDYYSLGLLYDRGPWQVQFMLNHIEQGSKPFESSDAAYALVGYRIGAVTPFAGYSRVISHKRPATPIFGIPAADQLIAGVMADSHADQHTYMLGARWDVARNVALKVQWDAIRGEPESIFPFRGETPAWSGKMNVLSTTLDFIF